MEGDPSIPRALRDTYYASGRVQEMLGTILSPQSSHLDKEGDKQINNYRLIRRDAESVTPVAEQTYLTGGRESVTPSLGARW